MLGKCAPRSIELIWLTLNRVNPARSFRDQLFSTRSSLILCPIRSRSRFCISRPNPNASKAIVHGTDAVQADTHV